MKLDRWIVLQQLGRRSDCRKVTIVVTNRQASEYIAPRTIGSRREEISVDADGSEANPLDGYKPGEELGLLWRDHRDLIHRVNDVSTDHIDENVRRLMVGGDGFRQARSAA